MSDTTGGGDGGGGAGASGQDEGADNEPPHLAPSLSGHGGAEVRETSEEGAPPSPKRTKVSGDDQEQERVKEAVKVCGRTQEQTGSCLQEDSPSFEQSTCSGSNVIKNARFSSSGQVD